MAELDPTAQAIGELRQALADSREQRAQIETSLRDLTYEIRTLRTETDSKFEALSRRLSEVERNHDRLVNRGWGVLVGVGLVAGSAGASVKTLLTHIKLF